MATVRTKPRRLNWFSATPRRARRMRAFPVYTVDPIAVDAGLIAPRGTRVRKVDPVSDDELATLKSMTEAYEARWGADPAVAEATRDVIATVKNGRLERGAS